VEELRQGAARLRERASDGWDGATTWFVEGQWRPAHFAGTGRNTNFFDCLGLDQGLDAAAERLLELPAIGELLDRVVGPERRVWFAQVRWAEPGGEEYVLHQDVYGELALCLYLDDHPDAAGSMVFWPGAHRWARALEALPHLEPRWVEPHLGHVDGVAGDLCLFFNKTWHGRKSARGSARLVFLISFLPPGPIEKPRRVPDDVRARLGPELRRVTDPTAARSFGDRPPAELPLSSSFEVLTPDSAAGNPSIAEYAWSWCRSQVEAEPLWHYRRLVQGVGGFTVLPRDTLEALREDFRRRAGARGLGQRACHRIRIAHALWEGEPDRARLELGPWLALGRDQLCEAPAHELDALVEIHAELGDDREALEAARALLDGRTNLDECNGTWSLLLMPLVRRGRFAEAAAAHARGYPAVREKRESVARIGLHLEYLALRADHEEGRRLYQDNQWIPFDQRCDGELWHFWCGAWLLFARMERAGERSVVLRDPRTGAELRSATGELARQFRGSVLELAGKLDRRNGNERRRAAIGELEECIERASLPEPRTAPRWSAWLPWRRSGHA
jgi:putative 2OG-Fe(II) oxygenase